MKGMMIIMHSPPTLDVLGVKVQNLENELNDLKHDIKEEMKDMKDSVKNNEKFLNETIVAMKESDMSLKENIKWLTKIADQQQEELKFIRDIKSDKKPTEDIHTKWYQGFISSDRKNLWIIVAFLLAGVLGYKAQDLIALLV